MKHTPEPWTAVIGEMSPELREEILRAKKVIGVNHGKTVLALLGDASNSKQVDISIADAYRIVACVNACEGMDPEKVPGLRKALKRISSHRLHATKHNGNAFEMLTVVVNLARAAIPKAGDKMKHTPESNIYHLPWEIKGECIVNVKGVKVLEWLDNIGLSRAGHLDADGRAFAELIVCAVNSHVDLLKALKEVKGELAMAINLGMLTEGLRNTAGTINTAINRTKEEL